MTKYAKCATCGYTLAISDAMDAGDYNCPVDGTTLVVAAETDHYNAANKLVKLDANAAVPLAQTKTSMGGDDLHTPDYGLNWEDLGSICDGAQVYETLNFGSGIAIFAGNTAHLYRTTDYGKNWVDLGVIFATHSSALCVGDNGVGLIADEMNHHIWRTTDYGLTWTDIGAFGSDIIIMMSYLGNKIFIFGNNARHIWRSADDGLTWSDRGQLNKTPYTSVYCKNDSVIVGTRLGYIWESVDMGLTWTQVSTLFDNDDARSFAYMGNGIILCGGGFSLQRSSDYGKSWTHTSSVGRVYSIVNLGNGVAVAGDETHIQHTADYGLSWTDLGIIGTDYMRGFGYLGNGVIIGHSNKHVFRSTSAFGLANFTPNQFDKLLQFGCLGAITPNGTSYLAPGNGVTQTNEIKIMVTRPGILKNLFVKHRVASGAGGRTDIYTVRVNGADKTITCTLDNATTGSDTTHEVLVAQGDEVSIKLVSNNGADTSADVVASLELV